MRSLSSVIFFRLALVITLSFVVTFGFLLYFAERFISDVTHKDSANTAKFLSQTFEINYRRQLDSLNNLVAISGPSLTSTEDIRRLLQSFLSFDNIYNTIHYYDGRGNLLLAERRSFVPPYRLEKNWFERKDQSFAAMAADVIKKKTANVSPVLYTSLGQAYQTFLVPHVVGNRVKGVFSGGIFLSPQQVGYLVQGLSTSNEHVFSISDGEGRVLLKSSDSNLPFILTTVKLPDLGFVVTYGVSTQFLEKRQKDLFSLFIVGLAMSLLVAFLITFVISKRISSSLEFAVRSLRRLIIGDFSVRIGTNKRDPFPTLSKNIDQIADKLEKGKFLGDIWSGEEELKDYLDKK